MKRVNFLFITGRSMREINFSLEEVTNLKSVFKKDMKQFTKLVSSFLEKVKTKNDIENFCLLAESLSDELHELAPFIAEFLNPVFQFMIKSHYYREVAKYISLISNCANYKTIEMLKEMIDKKDISKFIASVDMYKIKKLIFDVSQKKKTNENISLKLELEINEPELSWIDII